MNKELINKIKSIIREWGSFSPMEIFSECPSYFPKNAGNLAHMVEYIGSQISIIVYNDDGMDIDNYTLNYEDLEFSTLEEIFDLCLEFQKQQKEEIQENVKQDN